jgi:3-(3-hydroxy-phenyl)propionate hydroxylase
MSNNEHLIVVGGGPVGAVAALAAVQRGFSVTLLEAEVEVNDDPRAATFHPSTLEMLDQLGLIQEFLSVGLIARHFDFWDKITQRLVARLDHELLSGETRFPYVVQTEQHKLVRIILDRLNSEPAADVRLGCRFESLQQTATGVRVHVAESKGKSVIEGTWLVGCDGGRSSVRKDLGVDFEGYTFPERFVVLTTLFDFGSALGCSPRAYMAGAGEWTNLFKVAGPDMKGRWRAVFPALPEESEQEALSDEACRRRLASLRAGATLAELVHRKTYRVHQRVAARFRVGRAFLAGDAAHVNNPIGGLGLNCGIHDVFELLDSLSECGGGRDEYLLDRYERRRRSLNIRYVQEQTVANKRRLEEVDTAIRAERLLDLEQVASDPERQRAFLRRSSLLESVAQAKAIA